MSVPGDDLLNEIENDDPKLGIYLRNYLIPTLQPRGLAGHVLSTPVDAPGTVQLQPISTLASSANPKSQSYVGTSATGAIIAAATPINGITQLTGDVTAGPGSGPQASTVTGVNSSAVPVSKTYIGTNSAGQIIAAPTPVLPVTTPAVAHEWLDSYDAATGAFTQTQPTTADIAGFADNETVSGSGTAFTLANAPSPAGSLILVQWLSGFGGVVLIAGRDYTLSGAAITTTNSITAGTLYAWYRY